MFQHYALSSYALTCALLKGALFFVGRRKLTILDSPSRFLFAQSRLLAAKLYYSFGMSSSWVFAVSRAFRHDSMRVRAESLRITGKDQHEDGKDEASMHVLNHFADLLHHGNVFARCTRYRSPLPLAQVYMHVCMYVCMCVCIYIYIIHVYNTHICIYIYIYIYIYI